MSGPAVGSLGDCDTLDADELQCLLFCRPFNLCHVKSVLVALHDHVEATTHVDIVSQPTALSHEPPASRSTPGAWSRQAQFLHELYEAGALGQEVIHTGQTQNSLRVDDRVGGFWTGIGGVLFGNRLIAEAGIPGKYTWTPLPKNEQGVARYVHEPLVGAATVITSQSKNPEVAIKWLDYVWASPQGYLYANYGLEGEHYNINPEKDSNSPWLKHFGGLPEYSDAIRNNPEGKSVQTVLSDIGAFNHPLYADDDESFTARFSADPFSYELTQLAAPIAVAPFPRYLGTPEQERRLRALREEINPTQEEWTFKFITGQETLDRFDDYVAIMKRVGVDELVEIVQEQHDAYTASSR